MRKERKILRFVPQKLRKSFSNGNPIHEFKVFLNTETLIFIYKFPQDSL